MSKVLAVVIPVALFLHWLAASQVTVTVDGAPVAVPALAVAAVVLIAVSAAVVALVVYRIRAERAAPVVWQARKRAAGGTG